MNASSIVVNGRRADALALREIDGPVLFERRGSELHVTNLEAPMKHHLKVVWGSFALLVALLVVVPVACAAEVFRANMEKGPMSLKLLEARCSDAAVLKHLMQRVRPDLLDKFKDARLHWEGKDWASCWIELDGMVYSMDAEGAPLQPIPRALFKEDSV